MTKYYAIIENNIIRNIVNLDSEEKKDIEILNFLSTQKNRNIIEIPSQEKDNINIGDFYINNQFIVDKNLQLNNLKFIIKEILDQNKYLTQKLNIMESTLNKILLKL